MRDARTSVVVVGHTAQMGGAEGSLLRLVTAIDADAFRITAVVGEEGPFAEQLDAAGVRVVVVPLDPRVRKASKDSLDARGLVNPYASAQAARAAARLQRVFRSLGAQIVHTNTLKAHVLGGLAGRAAGARVLWHVRDHLAAPYLPLAAVRAMRAAARVVPHRVVAVSASAARCIGRDDVTVLHQGVPLPELAPERRTNGRLRVGIVGRISPWKGQDVFLDAAAMLADEHPEVEFVVVGGALFGEDELERELRARAERAPLAGRVRFTGFREDVWSIYRELDVAVHASTQPEPYGNVILEAMASRTPIVAAAAGGAVELVEHGRNGLLVRPGDPAALAETLRELLRDPAERRRLGRAGRCHVEQRFSLVRDAEAVESLYRELAA